MLPFLLPFPCGGIWERNGTNVRIENSRKQSRFKDINSEKKKYMKICFALAKRGSKSVLPNPLVGCVVLDKTGNIVSKGYHKKYGENHAERDALLKLQNNEAEGGTLYVNLEPCSHYGQTPPCTDIIIEKKLARVVYAMKDPNPKVSGADLLKKAGIQITEGILKKEAVFLNRIFIKNITYLIFSVL